METLLCRRFELARASGTPLEEQSAPIREHMASCEDCLETMRLDQAIAETGS